MTDIAFKTTRWVVFVDNKILRKFVVVERSLYSKGVFT